MRTRATAHPLFAVPRLVCVALWCLALAGCSSGSGKGDPDASPLDSVDIIDTIDIIIADTTTSGDAALADTATPSDAVADTTTPGDTAVADTTTPDTSTDTNAQDSDATDVVVTGDVTLAPGDDFQAANDANPAGTIFVITSGVHTGQRVNGPKDGNTWLAESGAVMDGEDSVDHAFGGSATDVTVRGVAIRNYADNGIDFGSGSGVVIDGISVYETGSGDGEGNGAVSLNNMTDVTVVNCRFERVSSGVLPTNCAGPIVIEHNTGLNTGRNFVQLAAVSGGGIRVRYNSMDRDGTYVRPGNDDVEDWISVWSTHGLANDYVQIAYNRARGHGPSASGSFVMLGDGGGTYQEAFGNVGVTPGQVGIGLSGGHNIEVRDNVMFSESWADSNIAFYSADYGSGGCTDHVVTGNRANWINRDGIQNTFWTAGDCTPLTSSGNTFPDASVDASIWDAWP